MLTAILRHWKIRAIKGGRKPFWLCRFVRV